MVSMTRAASLALGFLATLATRPDARVAALLPLCADQFAAADTCWATELCVVGGECDIPDQDPDKTCAEENETLDESEACCPACAAEVEAIRACRGCGGSGPSPNPPTPNMAPAPTPTDQMDDPAEPLEPCADEIATADTCWSDNQCELVTDCDAVDPDTDKTCAEETQMIAEFQACCAACYAEAEEVLICRCPGSSSSGQVVESAAPPSGGGKKSAAVAVAAGVVAGLGGAAF